MSEELKRRDILKFTAGTVVAARAVMAQGPHKFFTPDEYAMVDEITEILIPSDELSKGARAAEVAAYIDMELAEAFEDEPRQKFRAGLVLVDKLSQKLNKTPFLKGTPQQREAVLLQMAVNEKAPKAPEELFFAELKDRTVKGFYTSKIGIHDALDYKGNVYQPGDYAGVLPVGPALGEKAGSK